uniref:Uncharacterized protein n=1 Tax=Anopheles minimus TaxID=112268 RepID=A0A182WMN7_9DIPT
GDIIIFIDRRTYKTESPSVITLIFLFPEAISLSSKSVEEENHTVQQNDYYWRKLQTYLII